MWNLTFISEKDFTKHVTATIEKYGENLLSYDLKRFNRNIVDPIKLIFDKMVYQLSWEEIIDQELSRQRDKSNNNEIGYFHRRMFSYIQNCRVPENGTEGSWDIIYENPVGCEFIKGDRANRIYVELKNKHNTMNSSSSARTYIRMQNQLLHDEHCACFLVEAIAQRSQNIEWKATIDHNKVSHKRIRRVSIDQFYALITGQDDAFYQLCMILPTIIQKAVQEMSSVSVPHDTVIEEILHQADSMHCTSHDLSIAMAIYMLGFGDYLGFEQAN